MADTFADRSRGLSRRRGFDGALLLPHTRSVHSLGMRFPLDVAFLDGDLIVIEACLLRPWRVTRPRIRSRQVLEAEAGAFERWKLRPGDKLELRTSR